MTEPYIEITTNILSSMVGDILLHLCNRLFLVLEVLYETNCTGMEMKY